jgi:aryl-phospho-beta-D-glucosidase BglC (GH1 family)
MIGAGARLASMSDLIWQEQCRPGWDYDGFRKEAVAFNLRSEVLNRKEATMMKGIACLLLAVSTMLPAQTRYVHADGKNLVTPDGRLLLLRGTSLGNWLEPEGYMFGFKGGPQSPREIETFFNELAGPEASAEFWHAYRDAYVTEEDIRFLRDTGANTIRVPLHYKFFSPGNNEGFALLDRVVGWAAKYHLYVILDMHCAPGGQTGTNIDDSWNYPWLFESAEAQNQLISIWKRIAEHYRKNPTVLGYDLLNEPIPHFPELKKYNAALEPLYKRVTAAVREVDPNHVIILGGAQWDTNFDVFGAPFDSNLMYSFHKYWMPPNREAIQPYLNFRDRYKVPIWLGESGENNDVWVRDFRTVVEKDEINWTFWTYKRMAATSAFVSWKKPANWDEIVAFAKTSGRSGEAEKQIAARPLQEHIKEAMHDLLENVRLEHCQINPGYIEALGLKVPEK